jgi:hypothetical protein
VSMVGLIARSTQAGCARPDVHRLYHTASPHTVVKRRSPIAVDREALRLLRKGVSRRSSKYNRMVRPGIMYAG